MKPDEREVEVHQSGQAVKIHLEKDTVSGGTVLSDFSLKVADIFA